MDFIQHSINWARGEIFEGIVVGVFGVLMIIISILFWRLGVTPNAKAMFLPLLAVGLLFAVTGVFMGFNNHRRITLFEKEYQKTPITFIEAEKKRVEDFQPLYTFTLILAPVCFAIAVAIFWLSLNPHLRAIGISLVIIGLAGLVIDSFSKERADTYYTKIQRELEGSQK